MITLSKTAFLLTVLIHQAFSAQSPKSDSKQLQEFSYKAFCALQCVQQGELPNEEDFPDFYSTDLLALNSVSGVFLMAPKALASMDDETLEMIPLFAVKPRGSDCEYLKLIQSRDFSKLETHRFYEQWHKNGQQVCPSCIPAKATVGPSVKKSKSKLVESSATPKSKKIPTSPSRSAETKESSPKKSAVISNNRIEDLVPEKLGSLDTRSVAEIPLKLFSSFTEAHITALKPAQFALLQGKHLEAFSPQALGALSVDQVKNFGSQLKGKKSPTDNKDHPKNSLRVTILTALQRDVRKEVLYTWFEGSAFALGWRLFKIRMFGVYLRPFLV